MSSGASLDYTLEELLVQAINEGADFGSLPDTVKTLRAVHERSDDDSPLGAITVCAKVGDICNEGGHPNDCEVTIATRVPIKQPDVDGNSIDIPATDEDALWAAIEFIILRLGLDENYLDGLGFPTNTPNAFAFASDSLSRLTWIYSKSKTARDDGDKFRHRSRMIPCRAAISS